MLSFTQKLLRRPCLLLMVLLLTLFPAHAFSQQKRAAKTPHNKLKTFEVFLEKNPGVAADLGRDPSLIDDQNYLAQHPDLQQFLKAYPAIREEILSQARPSGLKAKWGFSF